ncbi:hypothetical protein ACFY93_14710 [Streptomyces sp. NPDC008313]|uniref:hypothetical protein n=1 Tax=Streptomyces sp. NPDC008313 TaxID=3364826 RepID=UPI0036E7DB34
MLRRIPARYSRGLGAALIAVAALVTAANAGPSGRPPVQPGSHVADDSAATRSAAVLAPDHARAPRTPTLGV